MGQCRKSSFYVIAAGLSFFCWVSRGNGKLALCHSQSFCLFWMMTLGFRHWLWAFSCPLPRELDHNDISGTIEDTNGAFTGLENLSKLWVSLVLKLCKTVVCLCGSGLSPLQSSFPWNKLEINRKSETWWFCRLPAGVQMGLSSTRVSKQAGGDPRQWPSLTVLDAAGRKHQGE